MDEIEREEMVLCPTFNVRLCVSDLSCAMDRFHGEQ